MSKWYNWIGDPAWDDYCRVGGIVILFCLLLIGILVGVSL